MEYLKKAQHLEQTVSNEVEKTVKEIISTVKTERDAGVKKYEERFSKSVRALRVSEEEIEKSVRSLSYDEKALIDRVVERISSFAKAQLECISPLEKEFGPGIHMGHRIVPIEKVGAYIPGGRFPLLSSGPMVVAPAKVAGAKEIVACSPANYEGGIHPAVLYGLVRSGATHIYAIGGAQAIAAMAYGTESVPEVDVIAGPGNRFVAEAKKQVFGKVGIDLIAGPSEVLVFTDDTADPKKCAADLLAQAEHDPYARPIMVSTSRTIAEQTIKEVEQFLKEYFSSDSPAHESWAQMGEVIYARSLEEGLDICNDYAIEHLHVHVKDSRKLMDRLHNYGSLFLDSDSSVVFSDKVSGTNHTLPTLKAARYTGGLWVGNYVKVITHQEITGSGVDFLATHATEQSNIEGLEGHRLSAELRLSDKYLYNI
ncbi:histidinol dehydrogenase/sulfopropanediol 3-dehydrogenase [Scopulibacillus darangshiensis]|uniref:Histidinol dehydrogenase/sulfopropanediol 3-dehydrogenase n=1 Tax=Scopulibacillus darangshiensis TaxID=442528 RepID=A0A4R2P9P4_9BACL|nr:histidinol dehydrogenase [Scopulibacillus darangshiensis]TCP30944.1 histidinol dehydrogenase/sulfopropanediol 3-dehydrogenase [Scopulibacillus darangshiensis]